MPSPTQTLTVLAAVAALMAAPASAQEGGGSPPPAGPPPVLPPPPPPPPPPRLVVDKPIKKLYVHEGPRGRLLLGGRWYFRQDDDRVGDAARYFDQRSLQGWAPISVPYDWNGADTTLNRSSVGWFRKEFELPRLPGGRRLLWRIRFESVNHRATVWLNGKQIGAYAPGYFPFELDLNGLRKGRNRLVVKVSTLRGADDLTHWRRASFNGYGTGGWWNFGGISREVYVRPIDGIDIEDVAVLPRLRCLRCAARVEVRVRMRNVDRKGRRVALTLAVAGKRPSDRRLIDLTRGIGGRSTREVVTHFSIDRPRLWQPGRPNLYGLVVSAAADGRRRASFYRAFGVRQIKRLKDGRVLLNGRKLQLRGASIHEDDPRRGAALTPAGRSAMVRALVRLHATVARAHYPLHPAFLEAFDRLGIMYWSQAPVYQVPTLNMANPAVRARAVRVNRDVVLRDRSHPSVLAWSIANELPDEESPAQGSFIEAAAREIRALDPTRLVAIDRQSQLGQPDPAPALQLLDAIGLNDYFGWYYASLIGRPSETSDFAPFLDQEHALYPGKALFVTEFGAESNRDGPDTEKGTYQFQARWMREHLGIYATRPFVGGAIAWILRDFRVHPAWGGGNPRPNPPWNNKGLIDESGAWKPAFAELRGLWRRTRPLR